MKVKISQIVQLGRFFESIKDAQIPIKTAYKLHQLKKEVDSNLIFYQNKVSQITQKYAEPTEKDQKEILVKKEHQGAFYREIEELLNFSVEVPEMSFEISDFDNLRLSFEILEPIFNFIK